MTRDCFNVQVGERGFIAIAGVAFAVAALAIVPLKETRGGSAVDLAETSPAFLNLIFVSECVGFATQKKTGRVDLILMAAEVLNSRILRNIQRLLTWTRKKNLKMTRRMLRKSALLLPTFSSHGSLPTERSAARIKCFLQLTIRLYRLYLTLYFYHNETTCNNSCNILQQPVSFCVSGECQFGIHLVILLPDGREVPPWSSRCCRVCWAQCRAYPSPRSIRPWASSSIFARRGTHGYPFIAGWFKKDGTSYED